MADASGEGSLFIRCMRDIRGGIVAERIETMLAVA